MRINEGVEIDNEAIASILTSGLIGDKYVSIALGGGDKICKNGGTIRQTQSAFVLENAIGQLINNVGSGSKAARREADRAAADLARPPRAAVAAARRSASPTSSTSGPSSGG